MAGNLEVRTLALSESTKGDAIVIAGTAWNSATDLHIMTVSDAIDGVFLRFWNSDTTRALVKLILNPTDTATQATVDATTVDVWIPAQDDAWALQGDRFWKGAGSYTIAAYVNDSGQASKVRATGWVHRQSQVEVTP